VLVFPACHWLSGMRHKAEVSRGRTDDKGAWIVRQMGDKMGKKILHGGGSFVGASFVL
jgi:hypothetical protein